MPASVRPFVPLAISLLASTAAAQTTTRESVDSFGVQPDNNGATSSLSGDGRFVAFQSAATNLVPGDTNGVVDIFVRDRWTGQVARVSVDSAGAQGNGSSTEPRVSSNGRFVVFESNASNLVAGDTNNTTDVFCHDRQTGQTTRVSLGAAGQQATSFCEECTVSGDGRFVVFQTGDNSFVPGDNNLGTDVFVRDRQAGTTTLASPSLLTGQVFTSRYDGAISDDGNFIAFRSAADDLVANDFNGTTDVFVFDRVNGGVSLASVSSGGAQGNNQSLGPALSADGRYVAFWSYASNFFAGDTSNADVFVHDRQTGTTIHASVGSSGQPANGESTAVSIAANGSRVAFQSSATNLLAGDTNAADDCFVRDLLTGVTTCVSVGVDGSQGSTASMQPSLAADGLFVSFDSASMNLVPPQFVFRVFVYVRALAAGSGSVASYGNGCFSGPASNGPVITAIGTPHLGNSTFALGLGGGPASSLAVPAVSLQQANTPFAGCTLLVGGAVATLATVPLNAAGAGAAPFPLPVTPSLAGTIVYAQHFVLDANGPFLGAFVLTRGLAVTLGN